MHPFLYLCLAADIAAALVDDTANVADAGAATDGGGDAAADAAPVDIVIDCCCCC